MERKNLFNTLDGFRIIGMSSILSGSGIPGGDNSFQDLALGGSLYLRTTVGELYVKKSFTNTPADWELVILNSSIGTSIQAYNPILDDISNLIYSGNALKVIRVNASETGFELAIGGGDVSTDSIWNAKGDLVVGVTNNNAGILPVGINGQALIADSTQTLGVKWGSIVWSTITSTPTTLAGYGITDAQPLDMQLTSLSSLDYTSNALKIIRVNAGETGFELATISAGGISTDTIWNAKGDLAVGTANDTASILSVGVNNSFIIADSTQTTGMKWSQFARIDDSGLTADRTFILPDIGGTFALLSGNNMEVIFNDSGALGTDTSFQYDKTNQILLAGYQLSLANGAAYVLGDDSSGSYIKIGAGTASLEITKNGLIADFSMSLGLGSPDNRSITFGSSTPPTWFDGTTFYPIALVPGNNTEIIFNNNNVLGSDNNFTYDNTIPKINLGVGNLSQFSFCNGKGVIDSSFDGTNNLVTINSDQGGGDQSTIQLYASASPKISLIAVPSMISAYRRLSIEAGTPEPIFTVNITDYKMWHEGNMGDGSGLDSDLLDGLESSYYLSRINHTGVQSWSTITSTPTTLSGYGITDAQAAIQFKNEGSNVGGNGTVTSYNVVGAGATLTNSGTDNTLTIPGMLGAQRLQKTAAYLVVANDRGSIIDCTTGTFTVSLTASATLGDGFTFAVFNSGSGIITIDPDGSETIRTTTGTNSTITLAQGYGVILFCDGANWTSLTMTGATGATGPSAEQFISCFAGTVSTTTDSSSKLLVGEFYFDPTDSALGTSGTSTATLEVIVQTSSGSNTVHADLLRETGAGSPTVVATITPSSSTTSTLATVDVSTAFRPSGTAGIFAVRIWLTTNNGNDYATCTNARIKLIP